MIEKSVEINRIMSDVLQQHEKENKRLWLGFIAQTIYNLVITIILLWAASHMQETMNEAVLNSLNSVAELGVTQTTTTQTVEGDSATINNVEGEQYNDNSSKNGGES